MFKNRIGKYATAALTLTILIFLGLSPEFRRFLETSQYDADRKEQNCTMAMDKLELTREITDEFNEEIGVPAIFIYSNKRKKISLTSSKFGDLPYWDNSQPYPTDKNGNKLKLLVQINLSEVFNVCQSNIGLLPNEGILQFFFLSGDNYLYGSDLDDYTNNNHFRVIYHSSINPNITTADVLNLHILYGDMGQHGNCPLLHKPQ